MPESPRISGSLTAKVQKHDLYPRTFQLEARGLVFCFPVLVKRSSTVLEKDQRTPHTPPRLTPCPHQQPHYRGKMPFSLGQNYLTLNVHMPKRKKQQLQTFSALQQHCLTSFLNFLSQLDLSMVNIGSRWH